jgi:hypothetical protein
LRDDGSVFQNFLLDKFGITAGQAVINDFINSIVLSALVFLKVVLGALALGGRVRHALLRHESLSLAPVQNSVHIPALTIVVVQVA